MTERSRYFDEMNIDISWHKKNKKTESKLSNKLTFKEISAEVNKCEKCDLHKTRTNAVFGSGSENP